MGTNTYQVEKKIVDEWMLRLNFESFKLLVRLYVDWAFHEYVRVGEIRRKIGMGKDDMKVAIVGLFHVGSVFILGDFKEVDDMRIKLKVEEEAKEYKNQILEDLKMQFYQENDKSNEIGYVYVLYDTGKDRYKIGKARNVEVRLRQLKTYNPEASLLLKFKSKKYSSDEVKLHKLFRHKHLVQEWFQLDRNDLEIINNYFKSRKLSKNIDQ